MNGLLGHAFGMKIIESSFALVDTGEPLRKHLKKPWMSENYHKRIQKKWVKRWGNKMKPAAYKTPQGIVCHPTIATELRRQSALPNLAGCTNGAAWA